MKKTKIIVLIGHIFLASILIVLVISIMKKVPNNIFCFLDIGTYGVPPESIEVNMSNTCGQSFVSNFDNLFMMSIFIPSQNLAKDGHLCFHLKKNKDDQNDLVTLKWRINEIRFLSNNFYIAPPDREITDKGFHFHFQFPPIRNSKNKEFYFYFDSPGTRQGEGIKLGLWDNRQYYEALTKGTLYKNNKPINGFLAFRTYNTWIGNPSILMDEIKIRLLKDRPFLIFYCASLFIILTGTIITCIKINNLKGNLTWKKTLH